MRLLKITTLLCALFTAYALQAHLPHFLIVIPTYHNKDYCIENIESLIKQTHTNWTAVIVVDGSRANDDGTGDLLEAYIAEHDLGDHIILARAGERKLALRNIYETIYTYGSDDWVVVLYDGDDFFTTPLALERIAQEYDDPHTWLTYGSYIDYPAKTRGVCQPIPPHIMYMREFRKHVWVASHPRTFYVWLFKKIKKEDLLYHGTFYPMAWDLPLMFPMLEMASQGHIRFIPDTLYAYRHHERNDYNKNITLLLSLDRIVRHKPPYPALDNRANPLYQPSTATKLEKSEESGRKNKSRKY